MRVAIIHILVKIEEVPDTEEWNNIPGEHNP
jgi:hypothetical protein